jgi:hypothetical protein
MDNLADIVLEYYWFLNFSTDEELDPDTAVKSMENLAYTIETAFSADEQRALQEAAKRSLASWLREPDEHGYTPRSLLTPEKRAFLQDIAAGRFSGPEL